MKALDELSDAEYIGLCVDSALERVDESDEPVVLMQMMYNMLDAKLQQAQMEADAHSYRESMH